jgi:putative ABC transport system permease protein
MKFTPAQEKGAAAVCVIGYGIKTKFFAKEDALGKVIKVGKNWLTIVGVAGERKFSQASRDELGIRDFDMDIYVPIETALLRYQDRQRVTMEDIRRASMEDHSREEESSEKSPKQFNYHQIDRLIVTLKPGSDMYTAAEIIRRMLARRHNDVVDMQVRIPEEILAQKQAATDVYNMVLISIAALSLLIGGIGIMNIMLASVMERIKEIGVRLSLGATKRDIVIQFLGEAVALSVAGGILGILVGFALSMGIEQFSGVKAIVTSFSIFIAFFVSVVVGIIFGFFPARKAAQQDPVISLRYE